MIIRDMFRDDINRTINGVIQVEQDEENVIADEVKEYVVTSELKKHFDHFFATYSDSFDYPTDNIGVWITGFFGSGKSHFLKMLSYILENKKIKGKRTVDYFRDKFEDELSFLPIQKATSVPTETILFNIDVEGPMEKDATAVLKVFAKVFYDHLGFYGNDLKVAKLEQFITKKGKMDAFLAAFKEKNGDSWQESRASYAFFEDDIVECLEEVLGMSRESAQHWFDGTETVDMSISQLVNEIKDYVASKPKDFRLLFMIDEVGQYVGTDTNLLLNLQSLIEKLGSVCRGQVWVVATGQEALDDMIKVRMDEFSRIMARFKVRLSLTSSSVGEVVEKRLLAKTPTAKNILEKVYENNDAVLRNLFAFDTNRKDIRGYKSSDEFIRQFPFVPYQFIVMPNVYNEIRKHGHTGKHHSKGERTMLDGTQFAARDAQARDEFAIVPLYGFYDAIHSSLDTSIQDVIERAVNAEKHGYGIEKDDVNLLKLLYLIRYIDDIPANVNNLTVLMADDIRVDKLELKEKINESLNRLINQNYVSRNGDQYMFLTDEEQDIARDIKNTDVDSATVVSQIGSLIFDDIYTSKKYRYNNKYDFEFNSCIDGQNHGVSKEGMTLKFYTVAADPNVVRDQPLINESMQDMAICLLSSDAQYYENLEMAAKIKKYIKQKNINQLASSVQKIVQDKQTEANRLEKQAKDDIKKAIVEGKFFVKGEILSISGTDANNKINEALKYLVEHTYTKFDYIDESFESDQDITQVLKGLKPALAGTNPNKQACDDILDYLDIRKMKRVSTTMYDIQARYSSIPYGWREQDIAGAVARLINDQKITVKVSGQIIPASDYRMVGFLRKKSEIGNTQISRRELLDPIKIKRAKDFLREYFNVMDLPGDEDGLFSYIDSNFRNTKSELDGYYAMNSVRRYPGYDKILEGQRLVGEVLKCTNDGVALIDKINSLSDDLLNNREDLNDVSNFFKTQKTLFDNATLFNNQVKDSLDYFVNYPEVKDAVDKIKGIITYQDNYSYSQIKDLNGLMSTVMTINSKLVSEKKTEINEIIDQCISDVQAEADKHPEKLNDILKEAKAKYTSRKDEVNKLDSLPMLDAKRAQIWGDKDHFDAKITNALRPPVVTPPNPPKNEDKDVKKKKQYKNALLQRTTLRSKEDINNYVESLRKKLEDLLSDCDELDIE